jgi:hypothetical protein
MPPTGELRVVAGHPSAGEQRVVAGQPAAGELRVVAGQPAAEEIAALTVVLAARLAARERAARAPSPAPGRRVTGWAQRSRLLRAPLAPGPGAWRRSARP